MEDTNISRNKRRRMREKDRMIMLNEELVHLRQQMAALKEGSNRSSTEMAELRCTNKQLLDSLHTERESFQAPRQVSEELNDLEEADALVYQPTTTEHRTPFKDQESQTDVESYPDFLIFNYHANEKEDLKEENSSLKEEIEKLQKQLADERKNNEDNKVQIESLRVKAKTFEDHSTLLAYELHEMTVDRNSLLNALEGKHEKIKTIEAKWKAKVKKMADQHEVKLYDEQVKSYRLRVQNKNLKAELDQVKNEMEDQKLQLTVTNFLNDIVNDVEGLVKQREIASLRDHIQQLQFELAQAENVKRLQQHKEEQGAEEYKKLFDQYQIVEQQNQLLEEDNTLLKKRVLVMRQENTEAHEKFLEEQTDRINAKMSFVAQIKQLEENCTSLKEANVTLSKDGQRLKSAFERKHQDNDGLMEVIEDLMQRVAEKENIIEELQAKKRRGCIRRFGDIVDLERNDGKTDVIVNEGVSTVSYTLDEGLIEFGTAIDDGDFGRAITFLESLDMTPETEAMWKTLSKLAVQEGNLPVAERCYAALGDVSKARFLHQVNELVDDIESKTGMDGSRHPLVQAKLAVLNKQFKKAEGIYLEQGMIDQAMEMYQELHKWDDSLEIAARKGHPELENLRSNYLQYLSTSGQEEKAGEVKESQGEYMEAINLYMKAGLPARAARLALSHDVCNVL
eukprot:gene7500-13279_t